MAKNEFEELDVDELAPEPKVSEVVSTGDSKLIASGAAGIVYDWTHAPEGVKAPPRVDLSGKVVTIKKADVILPAVERSWEKTKAGDKEFKYCTFTLFYDTEGQQENYSGVRVFKREESGEAKYSHPTITRDRKNQASRLLGIYADFKKKDINEVSLREFLAYLNSQPKCKIMKLAVANPETGAIVEKNVVQEFVQ
jgi:hypothetical protein